MAHDKPLQEETRARFIALCERMNAESADSVSPPSFYDALNEFWQSMSEDERVALVRELAQTRRK